MADPTPPLVTPGKDTSEFSLAKFLAWLGTAVTVLGAAAETVSQVQGALKAVPATATGPGLWIAIIGALVAVIPSLYYKWTRLQLKTAAIQAAGAGLASDAKAAIDAA